MALQAEVDRPAPPRKAPHFLTLWKIRFPIGAIASIGHRLSGLVLLVLLPPAALALDASLRNRESFDALFAGLHAPWTALLVLAGVWAVSHHLLAGIRHLLMDAGVGWRLAQARATAWIATLAPPIIAVAAAVVWSLR